MYLLTIEGSLIKESMSSSILVLSKHGVSMHTWQLQSIPSPDCTAGSGYSSIAGAMLPSETAFTLKAFLARANGEVTHVADVHDVKLIELYSVALKLECVVPENIHTPHGREWKFRRGGGERMLF